MPETTPLIKAALNLRGGAGFDVYISTVVLYCLMKVKAESDELYEELMRKHFYGRSDDIPASDKTEHLKGCG